MASQIYDQAWTPLENGQLTLPQAAQEAARAAAPVLAALCAGKRHRSVPGNLALACAAHAGRSWI